MGKTNCCNLEWIGENHNPIHTAKYCRNCGDIKEFVAVEELKKENEKLQKDIEAMNFNMDCFGGYMIQQKAPRRILQEFKRSRNLVTNKGG